MKGRRIVLLRRSLTVGGSERQLVTLANALAGRGFEVTVISMYSGGVFASALDSEQVRLIGLDKKGRWDLMGFAKRLVSECREVRPDIMYGFSPVGNLLALLIKYLVGRPRIVWGLRASNMPYERYGVLPRLIFKLTCALSRFADLIIANSYAGRDYHLAQGFPERKAIVIPNGIDTDYFRPELEAGLGVRAEWKLPRERLAIGLVGRLDPVKGHEAFLRAAAVLHEENNRLKFICVGDGPEEYKSRLTRLARELGLGDELLWAGECGDMPAVYSALDLCVSSSVSEGFPNVVGEAMACGVPCVVTDVGDSARIVGGTGVVVPPNDVAGLIEGVPLLLRRLEREGPLLRDQARRRILENFNSSELAEKTIAALAQLS